MTRSTWKLPHIPLILFQNRFLQKSGLNIRIRNSVIPTIFMEKKIKLCIFNGTWFLSTLMTSNMSGFKLGEFSFTKRSDTQTHVKRKVQKKPKGKK